MKIREILLEHIFKASIEREIQGTLGQIFIFCHPPNHHPRRFAIKTVDPERLPRGTTYETLKRFCHELQHWIRYRHYPLIITPFYTEFVEEWPYVAMPYCESNMREYIYSIVPLVNKSEAVAMIIQVLESLDYAREKGLLAHQDLKPENILLQNLRNRFPLPKGYPFNWRARVADFGLANAYMELGVPWGSRPYLAPEQYERGADLQKCDLFACGVILHELITGQHPIGKVTQDVWPKPTSNQPKKWQHEKIWKRWARKPCKLTRQQRRSIGPLGELIELCLNVEPARRLNHRQLISELLDYLKSCDENAHANLSVLLDHYRSLCVESETSGDSDERYQQRNLEMLTKKHLH